MLGKGDTRLCHDAGRSEPRPLRRARARPSSTHHVLEQCVNGPRGCERGIGETGGSSNVKSHTGLYTTALTPSLCLAVSAHEVCVHTARLYRNTGRFNPGGVAGSTVPAKGQSAVGGSDGMAARGEHRATADERGHVSRWVAILHKFDRPCCKLCRACNHGVGFPNYGHRPVRISRVSEEEECPT